MSPEASVTIHLPFYVVPSHCATNCRRLRKVKDQATLKSVEDPACQMIVICDKPRRFGCNANDFVDGLWIFSGGSTDNPVYYGNPGIIIHGYSSGTVDQRVKAAQDKGNAQKYTELPAL